MKKEDKSTIIGQLTNTLMEYDNFYLTDLEALNAEKTSALRRLCFKENVKLVVVKNTLFKRALENLDADYSALYPTLKGNTPARLIKDFTKGTKGEGKPQLKAAYVQESFYVGVEHLDALASLKSREEMLGDVVGLLQSPMKNLISALQSSSGQVLHRVLQTLEKK